MKTELENYGKYLLDYFWKEENIYFDDLDESPTKYYKENIDTWLLQASQLKKEYPKKVAIFWSEIFYSNFSLQFALENASILSPDLESWSIKRKLSYIKTVFENAYNYFGLFALVSKLTSQPCFEPFEKWHKPKIAKKFHRNGNNVWKLNGLTTSGKNWALQNMPIFQFFPTDKNIIKTIRNAYSHDDYFELEDGIVIPTTNEQIKLTVKDINSICTFIRSMYHMSIHFYLKLFVKQNYWVLPTFFFLTSEKFNHIFSNVPFELLDTKSNKPQSNDSSNSREETKRKIDPEIFGKIIKGFAALVIYLQKVSIQKIWISAKQEVPLIDILLHPLSLKISLKRLRKAQYISTIHYFNSLTLIDYSIKKNILGHENTILLEVNESNYSKNTRKQILQNLKTIAPEILLYLKDIQSQQMFPQIMISLTIALGSSIAGVYNTFEELIKGLEDAIVEK